MKHKRSDCTANDLIIGCVCGLVCARCGACKCNQEGSCMSTTVVIRCLLAEMRAQQQYREIGGN